MKRHIYYTVAVATLALFLAGCSTADRSEPNRPAAVSLFGPFAGYVWHGPVRQVSAVIVVPRIRDQSPPGTAGTWIGAEAPAPGSTALSSPFFQVGVNEMRIQGSFARKYGRIADGDYYYAFWSSAKLGFHPRSLFQVTPGDPVRLSMTLVEGRWRIVAKDEKSGKARSFTVPAGGGTYFNQAIWQQEDVSGSSYAQLPYPDLSDPKFTNLEVNAAKPRARALHVSWMSADVRTFGPSPARADSFVVQPVRLSAASLHYQQTIRAEDDPAIAFDHDLEIWTRETHPRTIRTVSAGFARLLQHQVADFRSYGWPRNIRKLTTQLAVAIQSEQQSVLRLGGSPYLGLRPAMAAYRRSAVRVNVVDLRIKSLLGLPVTNFSAGSLLKYVRTHTAR
jgi:Peptidase A4 family